MMLSGKRDPDKSMFETRIDDFSFQVSAPADRRFWFRLERERDRDVITDFSLGSFPEFHAGKLLILCYGILGLSPRPPLVFRDILPGFASAESDTVKAAAAIYIDAGKELLAKFTLNAADSFVRSSRGKIDLVVDLVG